MKPVLRELRLQNQKVKRTAMTFLPRRVQRLPWPRSTATNVETTALGYTITAPNRMPERKLNSIYAQIASLRGDYLRATPLACTLKWKTQHIHPS